MSDAVSKGRRYDSGNSHAKGTSRAAGKGEQREH
jgi:hypothetical protein